MSYGNGNSPPRRMFDVCVPCERKGDKKVFWQKIGVAYESDKGGINIYLNALPIPTQEGCKLCLFVAEPKQPYQGPGRPQGQPQRGFTPPRRPPPREDPTDFPHGANAPDDNGPPADYAEPEDPFSR